MVYKAYGVRGLIVPILSGFVLCRYFVDPIPHKKQNRGADMQICVNYSEAVYNSFLIEKLLLDSRAVIIKSLTPVASHPGVFFYV